MFIDVASEIKDRLTMRDVLDRYGYRYEQRIPCPLHGGKDKNFVVYEKSYYCHSHCGGGDVISFVQKMFGLSFVDALHKLNDDFSLNLYRKRSKEDARRAHYQQLAAFARREREREEKERLDKVYWSAIDEWERLREAEEMYKPKMLDDDLDPRFVEALKKKTYQDYLTDCLDEERHA